MNNLQIKAAQGTIDLCWNVTLMLVFGFFVSLLPDMTFAANGDSNAIEQVFCNVVGLLTGPTGKAIATVAIIAVGIGALLGKISWGMALIVALGVALIFGAATIVDAIQGGNVTCTTGSIGSSTR